MEHQNKSFSLFSKDNSYVILNVSPFEKISADDAVNQHIQTEIMAVIDGSVSLTLNGNMPVTLSEGDIIFLDSMTKHTVTNVSPNASVFDIMFDECAFITDEFKVFNKQLLENFLIKVKHSKCVIPSESRTAYKIFDILCDLEEELSEEDASTECVIKALIILLYSLVVRHFGAQEDFANIRKLKHYSEVQKTMVYINENLSEELTLKMLADIAHMNKTYYSTVFKKVTGMTVWEYILNARIELAKSILIKHGSEYSITEIFGLCGFNNATAFNKTFKKHTGKTPTEFKNSKYNLCF